MFFFCNNTAVLYEKDCLMQCLQIIIATFLVLSISERNKHTAFTDYKTVLQLKKDKHFATNSGVRAPSM